MKYIITCMVFFISSLSYSQFKGQLLNRVSCQANDGPVSLEGIVSYPGLCSSRVILIPFSARPAIRVQEVPGLSFLLSSIDSARIKPPVLFYTLPLCSPATFSLVPILTHILFLFHRLPRFLYRVYPVPNAGNPAARQMRHGQTPT